MRVILLADGIVGAQIAQFLMSSYREDLFVVVTTEKNDIYLDATRRNIRAHVYDSDETLAEIVGGDVHLGLLAWWPKIVRKPLLNAPRLGFVNTHPSLLPYNRGKHYNFWALVEQVPFGVTLHKINEGIDTGDIVAQTRIDYDWCDTGETLYKKAQVAMVRLFRETYPLLRTGEYELKPQDIQDGSFHRASELEHASKINLNELYTARDLLNLLRARTFAGHPGCWFEQDGSRYEVSITINKVG
jgi:methionyl-tRNA formyltransferase